MTYEDRITAEQVLLHMQGAEGYVRLRLPRARLERTRGNIVYAAAIEQIIDALYAQGAPSLRDVIEDLEGGL